MAVCNAANEVAVAAFLDGQIRFTSIPWVIEQTLEQMPVLEPISLAVVEAADADARLVATEQVATLLRGDRKMGLV
jgi:1-deoxy-D-xylulose-5-phosphate reductoisomerase